MALFQRLLPIEFVEQLQQKENRRHNRRIFTAPVVMWLMIAQRLRGNGTLETAVLDLLFGSLPASFWPNPCKRLCPGPDGNKPKLSDSTASYSNARQQLSATLVEHCYDQVYQRLLEQNQELFSPAGQPAFFLDGTTVRLPHTPTLYQRYPPATNQHGESHWPLIRMLVAHDLDTGLAMRPHWASQAVSEQRLLEQVIGRLPHQGIVVGDVNFGVFSVAYTSTQNQHPIVLRMKLDRAQRIFPEPLRDGIDRRICWIPSQADRKSHPELPAGACVYGRLIVRQVQPSNGNDPFLLILFTTLDWPVEAVIKLYGQRWNIETDLRTLKGTLQLEQLTCTNPEMVAKDIDMAMMAYNLVRAITCLAARRTGLSTREFSFTRVRNIIHAAAARIAAAQTEQEAQRLTDLMMHYTERAKLPKREDPRPSYPREVWGKPRVFRTRKA